MGSVSEPGPVPAPRPEALSSWFGARCFPSWFSRLFGGAGRGAPPPSQPGAVGVPRSGSLGRDLRSTPLSPAPAETAPALPPPACPWPLGEAVWRRGCPRATRLQQGLAASWDKLPVFWCPPPSVPRSCQTRKDCPGLKKETFINNLNTADSNGHTSEAYGMVRKEAGGLAAVRGARGGAAAGKGPARRGLCTEDGRRGGAMYTK